jgi:hypothetical protein
VYIPEKLKQRIEEKERRIQEEVDQERTTKKPRLCENETSLTASNSEPDLKNYQQ